MANNIVLLKLIFCIGLCCVLAEPSLTPNSTSGKPSGKYIVNERGCVDIDDLCLTPFDVANYEAIRALHLQLDDDRNGDIDLSESVDFLKDELQYAKGYEKRQKLFHVNNDDHISVKDLWHIWKQSEVHNWTTDQTISWLVDTVDLKQYVPNFFENNINGSVLPRLATNNEQFLTKVLGVKDGTHRSKITIKAMDAVLFGPPKELNGSYIKDMILVTLLVIALVGCLMAYHRNRVYEQQVIIMMKDMEKLREAEENLRKLEDDINSPLTGREEEKLPTGLRNRKENTSDEVKQLKKELEEVYEQCEQMKREREERDMAAENEDRSFVASSVLQHWLQLTFERERIAFEKKQLDARDQFGRAREMCDKVNRQRRSFMGVLASVHGKMDSLDKSISIARSTMEEVTHELRERETRWRNIELAAGCSIINNPGIHVLELLLRPQVNGRSLTGYTANSIGLLLNGSLDDNDDDCLSNPSFGNMGPTGKGSSASLSAHEMTTNLRHESSLDIRSVSGGSLRKRTQMMSQENGLAFHVLPEGVAHNGTHFPPMHHSHTFTSGHNGLVYDGDSVMRSSSANSLRKLARSATENSKDSSSADDETDSCAMFTMGGSSLDLDMEKCTTTSAQVAEKISTSEPALDSPSRLSRRNKLPPTPPEDGDSPPESASASSSSLIGKKKRWFQKLHRGHKKSPGRESRNSESPEESPILPTTATRGTSLPLEKNAENEYTY